MPGLDEEVKKVNRPIPELPLSEEATRLKQGLDIQAAGENGSDHSRQASQSFVNQSDAPACPNCGHVTVRNGACYKCLNCVKVWVAPETPRLKIHDSRSSIGSQKIGHIVRSFFMPNPACKGFGFTANSLRSNLPLPSNGMESTLKNELG